MAQKAADEKAARDADPEPKEKMEAEAKAARDAEIEAEFGLTEMGGFKAHEVHLGGSKFYCVQIVLSNTRAASMNDDLFRAHR